MRFKFLTPEEEKKLTIEELTRYYNELREFYKNKDLGLGANINDKFHKIYGFASKFIRKYDFEIRGLENIPDNEQVIFVCNHSNAFDTYTMHETLKKLFYPLTGSDCLNPLSYALIGLAGGQFIDRNDKESCIKGTNKWIGKILSGVNGVIFPESTWCLHPGRLLLPFKTGVIRSAIKADMKLIPIVFFYHEVDEYCKNVNQIIDKCIVQIGKPISASLNDVIDNKVHDRKNELRDTLATMMWYIIEEYDIIPRNEFDPMIYVNHNELKKNTLLFKYKSKDEEKFIYHDDDYIYEEYPLNEVDIKKKTKRKNRESYE